MYSPVNTHLNMISLALLAQTHRYKDDTCWSSCLRNLLHIPVFVDRLEVNMLQESGSVNVADATIDDALADARDSTDSRILCDTTPWCRSATPPAIV